MAQSLTLLASPFLGSAAAAPLTPHRNALRLRPAARTHTSPASLPGKLPSIRSQFRDKDEEKSVPEQMKDAFDRATGAAKEGAAGARDKPPQDMLAEAAERVTGVSRSAVKERQQEGVFATSGTLGFTKRNELFVGRVAMLGFAAAIVGEIFTGRGPLGQLNFETGIPVNTAPPLLLAFILFMIFGAFTSVGLGSRGYREADPQQPMKSASQGNWRGVIGLPARGPLFGFTRPNEFLNGRVAQLGFAACLLGEIATGRGAIGQLGLETGVPPFIIAPLLLVVPLMFVSLVNADYETVVGRRDRED